MRERPELTDDLTDLESEMLGVLQQAAGFVADMGFEAYRYKRLQPVIDKVGEDPRRYPGMKFGRL